MLNSVFPGWSKDRPLDVWYASDYRWPIAELEAQLSGPTRRADLVVWYLAQIGALPESHLHVPHRISFRRLGLVHDAKWLDALHDPVTLARIFSVEPKDLQIDEVLNTVRMAAGGTLGATRLTLESGKPNLNLLGGFHHAGKSRGGGFCAVNDIAVAVASVRALGFNGKVAILDLDAHPPDGSADCFSGDKDVWLGSISGSDWGSLVGVEEMRLPVGADDRTYLSALRELLKKMPKFELAFVLAGGDVLKGDRFGMLALTLAGARKRDLLVEEKLRGIPSVWLPGGGYSGEAWRVLAGTGLVLSGRGGKKIPRRYDPMSRRFAEIAREVPRALLTDKADDEGLFSQREMDELFGGPRPEQRLLHFYTPQGVEYALERYGFLDQLRRIGYHRFRIALDETDAGERMQLTGEADDERYLLVDAVLQTREIGGSKFLFINWLSLQNPRAHFTELRPALPGQRYPGLGLAREAAELFAVVSWRLNLAGVAFRPSWYHVAYVARSRFRFIDPVRQGRFEALIRDLKGVPLLEATQLVAEGKIRLDGQPYTWEAEDMVSFRDEAKAKEDRPAVEAVRDAVKFERT